jgi:hypothetical protein
MAHLIFSKKGYEALVAELGRVPPVLWLNPGVLSQPELEALHAQGVDVSWFSKAVDPENPEAVGEAVATICEHHPGHAVWVEHGEA